MNLLHALELLKQPVAEPASDRELFPACGFYSASSQDISGGSPASLLANDRQLCIGMIMPPWKARRYVGCWGASAERLCEVRDNYLSKNQHMLTAAKALGRRFLQ